jgi:hypothetical protein
MAMAGFVESVEVPSTFCGAVQKACVVWIKRNNPRNPKIRPVLFIVPSLWDEIIPGYPSSKNKPTLDIKYNLPTNSQRYFGR